ncbi:glycosyltransferase family 4 protein [Pseudomonadota bacterium]
MRLLINTLSIGSMSGEHVVYGFLRPMLRNLGTKDHAIVLHYENQPPPQEIKASNLTTLSVSERWRHWALRAAWEMTRLPALVKQNGVDRVLNVSGAITPFLAVPQVSLAMNPWCFVKSARSGWVQEVKAFTQRRAYRYAFRKAAHMVYISDHLRSLYRQANADVLEDEAESTIAYVGLNDALFEAAQQFQSMERKAYSILSVSAFAPWKGVQTIVEAVHLIRQKSIPATLSLVGPWPNAQYETRMRDLISKFNLQDAVTILGKIDVNELYRHYATHQVFCLMSSCESFGIPAAEAMAFGTPVVSTDCCAIAEVCDGAGQFGPVDDAQWTARALERLLSSKSAWDEMSETARQNASKLSWRSCVSPLLGNPSLMGEARQPESPIVGDVSHT